MSDEKSMDAAAWEEMLAKQLAKQKAKVPTRATTQARKPLPEKSFVSMNYMAAGQSDWDTQYKKRDPDIYVVLHFYLRTGDTFPALQKDARNYAQYFPHSKIIAHDHSWDSPCSGAVNLRKCKEV